MSTTFEELTVVILTFNEEENIERTLEGVKWARHILVVDSMSTDRTCDILKLYQGVKLLSREFDNHASQWNFGLSHVKTPWVLSLDADYVLPGDAANGILDAMRGSAWGYRAGFRYLVFGKPVRGSVLPPRTILYKSADAKYFNDGHTQRLNRAGPCELLGFQIDHDDRKQLSRWLQSQVRYAALEAVKIGSTRIADLSTNDKLRKLIFIAPPAVFAVAYIFRLGFLSGWRGLFYALQRFTAEILLSLFLIEHIIKRKNP